MINIDLSPLLGLLDSPVGKQLIKQILGNVYAWFEAMEESYLADTKNKKVKFIITAKDESVFLSDVFGYQLSGDKNDPYWGWEHIDTQNLNEMLALHKQAQAEETEGKKPGIMDMGKEAILKLLPKEATDPQVFFKALQAGLEQQEKAGYKDVRLVLTPMSYTPKGKKKPKKIIMGQLVGSLVNEEGVKVIAEEELTRFVYKLIKHAAHLTKDSQKPQKNAA